MTLRIGDTAPNFTIDTTQGSIEFHDWAKGSWVFFFSHPADYTPGLHNGNGSHSVNWHQSLKSAT